MDRFRYLGLTLALVVLVAPHSPARAEKTTTTVIALPEGTLPKTREEQESLLRERCANTNALPQGVERPDPAVCEAFKKEKERQDALARERAILEGHPVSPAKPEPPVRPVQ